MNVLYVPQKAIFKKIIKKVRKMVKSNYIQYEGDFKLIMTLSMLLRNGPAELKELDCRSCVFTSLPENIGGMISLEQLDLTYSELAYLPESFGQLRNLKRLHLNLLNGTSLCGLQREEDLWWQKKPYIEQLINVLEKNNLLEQIRYINIDDKYHEVNNIIDVLQRVNEVEEKTFSFNLVEDKKDKGEISIYLTKKMIDIQFVIENKPLTKELLKRVIKTTADIYQQFKDIALIGPSIYITYLKFSFPRFRPIREINFGDSRSILDFIDSRFYENESFRHLKMANMEKLYTEPLPEGCTREKVDDLYIFTWMDDFDRF